MYLCAEFVRFSIYTCIQIKSFEIRLCRVKEIRKRPISWDLLGFDQIPLLGNSLKCSVDIRICIVHQDNPFTKC